MHDLGGRAGEVGCREICDCAGACAGVETGETDDDLPLLFCLCKLQNNLK